MKNKYWILIIVLIAAILAGIYYLTGKSVKNLPSEKQNQAENSSTSPASNIVNLKNSECQDYLTSQYDLTFGYPNNWSCVKNSDNTLSLYPPGKKQDQSKEYLGDIIMDFLPNPKKLGLSQFYQQNKDINLYQNSQSQTPLTINGNEAVKFVGIPGNIETDIVSINVGGTIVEVNDIGQQHETDGITNTIANSIK